MDDSNSSENANPSIPFISDYSLDFIQHNLNYNHVIDMLGVSSETSDPSSIGVNQNYDPLILGRNNVSDNYSDLFPLSQDHQNNVFNNFNSPTMSCTNNHYNNNNNNNNNALVNTNSNSFSGFEGETVIRGDDEGEDDDDDEDNYMEGEHSSATTKGTNNSTSKKGKMDRSRTLISERKRRGRMKEKLYALRALVPNITKGN
ncbi:Transcription factor FER-LIKE IRON DEFICIENCY-INDUCED TRANSCRIPTION FACTOR [Bienertia sinuspersici]